MNTLLEGFDESRLDADEQDLLDLGTGAMGQDYSDYRHMYDLFQKAIQPALALKDSDAFLDAKHKTWDVQVMNVYVKLIQTAIKAMSELNRMRNADKMTSLLLEEHTQALSQRAARNLAVELEGISKLLAQGNTEAAKVTLHDFVRERIPEIFLEAGLAALDEVREEYGLQ